MAKTAKTQSVANATTIKSAQVAEVITMNAISFGFFVKDVAAGSSVGIQSAWAKALAKRAASLK